MSELEKMGKYMGKPFHSIDIESFKEVLEKINREPDTELMIFQHNGYTKITGILSGEPYDASCKTSGPGGKITEMKVAISKVIEKLKSTNP